MNLLLLDRTDTITFPQPSYVQHQKFTTKSQSTRTNKNWISSTDKSLKRNRQFFIIVFYANSFVAKNSFIKWRRLFLNKLRFVAHPKGQHWAVQLKYASIGPLTWLFCFHLVRKPVTEQKNVDGKQIGWEKINSLFSSSLNAQTDATDRIALLLPRNRG